MYGQTYQTVLNRRELLSGKESYVARHIAKCSIYRKFLSITF